MTAVHESGHAVVALHFGVPFEAVQLRIEAIDGMWHCGGRLRSAELPDQADNQRLWAQLVVIMAGYAAVSLIQNTTCFKLREFTFPDDRDYQAATDILCSMQPRVTELETRHAAMERAWSSAKQVLETNWDRVNAIAGELVRLSHPMGETVACDIVLTPDHLSKLLIAAGH